MPEEYTEYFHGGRIRVKAAPGIHVALDFLVGLDAKDSNVGKEGGSIAYRMLDAGEARELGHALLEAARVSGDMPIVHDGSSKNCHICRIVKAVNEMSEEEWHGEGEG